MYQQSVRLYCRAVLGSMNVPTVCVTIPVRGDVGLFPVVGITDKAAMNIHGYIAGEWKFPFHRYMFRVPLLGWHSSCVFSFIRTCQIVPW